MKGRLSVQVVTAPADFDFIIGDWQVHHRRLNSRLTGCSDWTEFPGRSSTRKILGGFGNVEDNILCFPDADVRAVAFRSFNSRTQTWAIWWLYGRHWRLLYQRQSGWQANQGPFYLERQTRPQPDLVTGVFRRWWYDMGAELDDGVRTQ